jgi:DNA-binding HxlR family transcriptional regulator
MPFASLAGALPASRDTITETLAKLEANGVIVREHSEGRTVYTLTRLGLDVGSACVPLLRLVGETDLRNVGLKKWPLLVAVALGRGAERYNEAKAALPGITARSLPAVCRLGGPHRVAWLPAVAELPAHAARARPLPRAERPVRRLRTRPRGA